MRQIVFLCDENKNNYKNGARLASLAPKLCPPKPDPYT